MSVSQKYVPGARTMFNRVVPYRRKSEPTAEQIAEALSILDTIVDEGKPRIVPDTCWYCLKVTCEEKCPYERARRLMADMDR